MAQTQKSELLFLQRRMERVAQNISQLSDSLFTERETLRQIVSEYRVKRVNLLKQELCTRGLTWCTKCSEVIPVSDFEFLLIEGRETYTHGYGNAYYGFRGFMEFHRACSTCRQRAADRHGQYGRWDHQAEDQTAYFAHHAERRNDGHYYACKFGGWVKLKEEECRLRAPSDQLIEKIAEDLSLPPKIEIDARAPLGEESGIIIYKKTVSSNDV